MPRPVPVWMVEEGEGAAGAPEGDPIPEGNPDPRALRGVEDDFPAPADAGA